MDISRIWYSLRLCLIPSANKRAQYMKSKKIFYQMGANVSIESRKIPLYPQLIKFHNNIVVASDVSFVTHDAIHGVMNRYLQSGQTTATEAQIQENVGCIEIMDNVFIGAGSKILNGVRIGPNVVIGAGSLVTQDIPPNSVAVGIPAKVIGSFDALCDKRRSSNQYPKEWRPVGLVTSDALVNHLWEAFEKERNS